ncbi:MAG: DNA repair protein RadC [Candidatus Marinimicrobia bacterium]|nr:DNA repair protein RadC [Candidatus Neomarinimicrobiota bacterium]
MTSNARSTKGHYRRLRERFLTNGLEGFLDYEVVELLLKLADPRPDHKPTAKAMMAKFGSLGDVLEAAPVLLKSIGGVGDKNIFGLKLVQAVAGRYLKEAVINKDYIQSSDQVLSYLVHHFKNRNREQFMIILLNGRNQIIDLVTLFEGTLTTSAVYPREVIKLILERDAAAVIFVHNHPSGNLAPSKDDKLITKRLKEACQTIDVQVHDHLIIGGNDSFSFAKNDLL